MQFHAPADHYDRFMGRYAPSLATAFAEGAGVDDGMRVLDVGCGPGGLTGELLARGCRVAAVDPAPQFVSACQARHPDAEVREGAAEALPWDDGTFDAALSQLVLHFMQDPDQGVREMARVTRPGGTVAACVWDIAGGGMTMLRIFWRAVREVQPGTVGEAARAGTSEGDIAAHLERAGLADIVDGVLTARAHYTDFDDFWEPFTLAVGPAGEQVRSLNDEQVAHVRDSCRTELPDGPFTLEARAWYARGSVPS